MNLTEFPQQNRLFETIRRFARAKTPLESCELCSAGLTRDHQHLVEPSSRKLVCVCDACTILFSGQSPKYRRVPRRVRFLEDFRLSEAQWESLMIPINMAFFFHSSPQSKVVALYPSPGGPTESLLPLDCWGEILRDYPELTEMEPDVEALLVNRGVRPREKTEPEHYLVPIDECYKLVGLIRVHWRGLSGGSEVWDEIERFFTVLKERSSPQRKVSRA